MKAKITVLALFCLFITGCSIFNGSSGNKLTESEQKQLIQFAQGVISKMPANKISAEDKHFIMKHDPEMKTFYTGYKRGKVNLQWTLPDKNKIQYKAEGDIMDFKRSFRGISFFNMKVQNRYLGQR